MYPTGSEKLCMSQVRGQPSKVLDTSAFLQEVQDFGHESRFFQVSGAVVQDKDLPLLHVEGRHLPCKALGTRPLLSTASAQEFVMPSSGNS